MTASDLRAQKAHPTLLDTGRFLAPHPTMKKYTVATLLAAVAGFAVLTQATPEFGYKHRAPNAVASEGMVVSDPDPADCPFCGGDPALHIRRMVEVQVDSMRRLAASLL